LGMRWLGRTETFTRESGIREGGVK
jgi:hypothetical protein